jgi:hypothetical protein
VRDQVSVPYKTTDKIIVQYILILKFFWLQYGRQDSALNDSKHSLTSVSS